MNGSEVADELRSIADKIESESDESDDIAVLEDIFDNSGKDTVFEYGRNITYPAVEVGYGYTSTGEMERVREEGFTVRKVRGGPNDSKYEHDNPVIVFNPR